MSDLNKYVVTNVAEYIELVEEISQKCDGEAWFRGHSTASYRLTPSILRNLDPELDSRGRKILDARPRISEGGSFMGINMERMVDEFRRRAIPFLTHAPKNDFEWLFIMQHYGVPTRLLDWTTNALVALYFAVQNLSLSKCEPVEDAAKSFMEGDEIQGGGFSIYALDPYKLNYESTGHASYPIDICEDERFECYADPMSAGLNASFPICVLAPHNNPRIRAQSGVFTLHGSQISEIDYYNALRPLIHKIFIPYEYLGSFQRQLLALGMTDSFIFPDLEGVAREVRRQEERRYARDREKWKLLDDSDTQ